MFVSSGVPDIAEVTRATKKHVPTLQAVDCLYSFVINELQAYALLTVMITSSGHAHSGLVVLIIILQVVCMYVVTRGGLVTGRVL